MSPTARERALALYLDVASVKVIEAAILAAEVAAAEAMRAACLAVIEDYLGVGEARDAMAALPLPGGS